MIIELTELWARLMYQYGPFAVIGFLMFVVERRLAQRIQQFVLPGFSVALRRVLTWTYGGFWIFITAIILFSVYAWYTILFPPEYVIKGELGPIIGDERFESPDHDLYTKVLQLSREKYKVRFRIVSTKPFENEKRILLKLTPGVRSQFLERTYELRFEDWFLSRNVELSLNDKGDILLNPPDRSPQPLSQVAALTTTRSGKGAVAAEAPRFNLLVRTAFGQTEKVPVTEKPDPEILKLQFGAQSYIVRDGAAETVAAQGTEGISFIEGILLDSKASPFQTLTAIRALNKQNPRVSAEVSSEVMKNLLSQCASVYRVIALACTEYAKDHPSAKAINELRTLYEGLSEAPSPESEKRVRNAARALLEALYQAGVRQTSQIRLQDNPQVAVEKYREAMRYFDESGKIGEKADTQIQQISPKIYWAIGLANVELARVVPNLKKEALLLRAKKALETLLKMVAEPRYAYEDHLGKARSFVESLDPNVLLSDFARTTIVYYQKKTDGDRVRSYFDTLDTTLMPYLIRKNARNTTATNAIWFGADVDFEQVKKVAKKLIENGVQIRSIRFFGAPGKKVNRIEIGSYRGYEADPLLTPVDIDQMTREQIVKGE